MGGVRGDGSGGESRARQHQTNALMQALGEFALFVAQVKRSQATNARKRRGGGATATNMEEKHAIVTWLKTLSNADLASLCSIVDVSFVKTILSMAMMSHHQQTKRKRHTTAALTLCTLVPEFQLIPAVHESVSNSTRKGRKDPPTQKLTTSTAAREFIRRPMLRTADGDVFGGFHSQTYEECCTKLLSFARILNTDRSCDTLTLSLEFFQLQRQNADATEGTGVGGTKKRKKKHFVRSCTDFFSIMETISYGEFLSECPSESVLKNGVWGETKWLRSRGYYSLAALLVNQIELNIWRCWHKRKKSFASPSAGFNIPVMGLPAKMHLIREWAAGSVNQREEALKQLGKKAMEELTALWSPSASSNHQSAQASLATLRDVLTSYQIALSVQKKTFMSVEVCFSCSLQEAVAVPQTAIMRLLMAAYVQEQCSMFLCEQLSREEENNSSTGLQMGANEIKPPNHSQRRRADRKKILKQRRHDVEMRSAQQKLMKLALEELKGRVRKKKEEVLKCVTEILNSTIDRATTEPEQYDCISTDKTGTTTLPVLANGKKKKKKRKKAAKMDPTRKLNAPSDNIPAARMHSISPSKENRAPNNVDYGNGTPFDVKDRITSHPQLLLNVPDTQTPLLGFFSSVDKSYRSPLSLTGFDSQPLYSSTPSTSFFLPLVSKEQSIGSVGEDSADEDKVLNLRPTANDRISDTNYEWYLPSLFSSQSSVHTTSTMSSLDWDFNNWGLKSDGNMSKSRAITTAEVDEHRRSIHRNLPPSSTKAYSLESFSKISSVSNNNIQNSSSCEHSDARSASSVDEGQDGEDRTRQSDFLYEEGGFFDRQRVLKRRRRPLPFDYEDDNLENNDSEDDQWENKYRHRCCGCMYSNKGKEGSGTIPSNTEEMNRQQSSYDELERVKELSIAMDRISKLEVDLVEKTKNIDGVVAALRNEVIVLEQTVSDLREQLQSVEAELQDLQLVQVAHKNVASVGVLDDVSQGVVTTGNSSTASSPLRFSPSQPPVGPKGAQSVPPAPSNDYLYSHQMVNPVNSSTAAFVSVPISVLPPRSKLHWDMCEFVAQVQTQSNTMVPAQMAAHRLCTATVQSLWPRAQVRPYGSFVTRLVLPSSDLDLVICLPKVHRDAPADAAGVLEGRNAIKETWQQNLARKLRQEPWVVPDSVKTLPHATIPIITLLTAPPYNVRLDISFEGPGHNGLATNDVVLSLIHEFPPLAPIMLVLKSFAIERGFAIAYSGGLSSYALLLMVARYLQEYCDTMPNGFENVSVPGPAAQSGADFGMMLMGFLDFYGNRFDPRTTGISVASRCFLNRESMSVSGTREHNHHQYAADDGALDDRTSQYGDHWQTPQRSPIHNPDLLSSPGSRRYGNRSSLDGPTTNPYILDQATHDPHKFDPIFIEDPLRPSNNVGRNCFRIMQIRRAFAGAYSTLMNASMSPPIFDDSRVTLVTGVTLPPTNLLRSILGPNTMENVKSDVLTLKPTSSVVPSTSAAGVRQDLLSMEQNYVNFYRVPAPTTDIISVPYHYSNPAVVASHYYGGGGGEPTSTTPSYLYQQQQHHQQQQQRMMSIYGYRPEGSYRRYSETLTERMTSRSDVDAAETIERLKERLGSPRRFPLQNSSRNDDNRKQDHIMTRKSPARSLSFADVVVGGSSSSLTGSVPTAGAYKREPTSPLALAPRLWRDDSKIDENMNEKWETKDDSEIKRR